MCPSHGASPRPLLFCPPRQLRRYSPVRQVTRSFRHLFPRFAGCQPPHRSLLHLLFVRFMWSPGMPPLMRGCPFRSSTEQSHPGICPSPMRQSRLSLSSTASRFSPSSTTSPPPPSRNAGSSTVPAKRESIPSLDSVSTKLSAPIRPAHSISDYNRRDFSRFAVPGSVFNLHVKY